MAMPMAWWRLGCRLESVMSIETLNQFTQTVQNDGQPAAVKELWASHVAL